MTELEDALRGLDPYSDISHPGTIDEQAAADLERIVNGHHASKPRQILETQNVLPFHPTSAPRRSWVKWSVAASAVIALAVGISVSGVLEAAGDHVAVAVPLPALVAAPSTETKSEAVENLRLRALATANAPGYDPQQYSLYEIGEADTDGDPATIGPVAKTHVTVAKNDQGNLMMTAVTEGAFGSDGRMIEYRDANGTLIKPGTSRTSDYLGPLFPQPSGQDSASLRTYIHDFQTQATALINEQDDLAVAEVMGYALQEGNVSQQQSAALLELIDQTPNIEYSGKVTDRMGRKGNMFSSEIPDSYKGATKYSLIFDADTGKLNAYEEVYLKGNEFPEGSTRKSVTIAAP